MKRPLLISLLLLTVACSQPSTVETFLRGTGPFEFTLDMSDSTSVWDYSFYTRVDSQDAASELQLAVTWMSPLAESFTETVYLPLSAGTSFFSKEACVPYRTAVTPVDYGIWKLTIEVPEPPEGLRGLGLVMSRSSHVADNQ